MENEGFLLLNLYALIILIVLCFIFFGKSKIKKLENNVYSKLLVTSLLTIIVGLFLGTILELNFKHGDIVIKLFNKLYLIGLISIITLFGLYTFCISKFGKDKEKKATKIYNIFSIINMIIITILPINVSHSSEGAIAGGLSVYYTYTLYGLTYFFLFIIVLLDFKNIKNKKYIPIIFLIIEGVIIITVLMLCPRLNYIINPSTVVNCLIMYFTLENPDIKLLRELNYQREQVENSKNISNKVINTISDSLSESVNKISTFGHKKINYDNTEELKKEITEVQKFALEFVGDINSLMELSKTQSEGFELSNTNYEPLQMLEETSNLLTTKNKNIKVTINKNSDVPAVLYGDPAKIKQCMLHLYTGILNISKVKNIELNTSYLIVGGLCRFKVSTDINASDLLNEYTKDLKDTVIDFEIIDRIIKLLEGKWSIELIGNKIVKIELSIDQKYLEGYYIKEETKSTMSKKINYSNLADKKVLIIDDDKQRTDEIMHLLSNYNIETTISADYNSTKKECTEKTFDLVIVDDIITELDRVKDFLLIDKTNGLLKVMDHIEYDVPRVIMVTPNTKDYETKYLEEGFDEVLTKPVDKYKLDAIIKAFLENSEDKDM